jgi:O-antigen ligase
MARKKRNGNRTVPETAQASQSAPANAAVPSTGGLPAEAGTGIVAILALMMLLAPALGVPNEELLQDTLKSIIVSFGALLAALLFFWELRKRSEPLRWHAIVWLPLLLTAYALGSIAWSHTYLASVEAIRWFVFSVIVWLGVNTLSREKLPLLAWGIHGGVAIASLWTALQFWVDFDLFPQGPNPASTFVNRNFFAEFAVCALPFSALLLMRARQSATVAVMAASSALVVLAVLMTGTRSALIALWLELLVILPVVAWRWRAQLALAGWPRSTRVVAAAILLATIGGLGLVPSGNSKILEEGRGQNALERGFKRTGSISAQDPSLGVRMVMWKATARVIAARPLSGVGAGAWESEIPLYQAEGSQLETDYYVHNEVLQLLAEYGLAGWVFLVSLIAYLLMAAWRTFSERGPQAAAEAPWRAVFLCSVLALLIVSNVGFPFRMAATGALFALCLGGLAASDARLGFAARWAAARLAWNTFAARTSLALTLGCLALAAYITQQAVLCEQEIVRATKMALTISASGDPNSPRWTRSKQEMLKLIRAGIDINPHYRKITPMVADELARWGDWKDAAWIWDSVLGSRPYVVAMLSNVARAYTSMGQTSKAMEYLARAKKIQPQAPAVRSLEVILLARGGHPDQALKMAREAIADNVVDYDLANAAFSLGWRAGDYAFAAKAMHLRMEGWPLSRADGFVQLGDMYAKGINDPVQAVAAYKEALALTPPAERGNLLRHLPPEYLPKLGFANGAPAP